MEIRKSLVVTKPELSFSAHHLGNFLRTLETARNTEGRKGLGEKGFTNSIQLESVDTF